jgi:hypothetical protein
MCAMHVVSVVFALACTRARARGRGQLLHDLGRHGAVKAQLAVAVKGDGVALERALDARSGASAAPALRKQVDVQGDFVLIGNTLGHDCGNAPAPVVGTVGACGIDIAWVALLADGQEISRDTHAGFTGGSPRKPVYTLDVPAPKSGVQFTLRAQVAGSGGTDSTGEVFWDLKPTAK